MQTILGSGGAIGLELAKVLPQCTNKIRLVSRNPQKVNPSDELFSANLLNAGETDEAIKGSDVVYVTVGFPYSTRTWAQNWPPFINNVLHSCKKYQSKLVFFDNIYMYDQNSLNGMTEDTPINPSSKKGRIRAQIASHILKESKVGNIQALIARSADFYGPGIKNTSMLTETVFNNLAKGKKATWMSSVKFKHSFTYTPDAGKATAILGNSEDAWGQVWHLPTASNPLTGKEWIEAIAKELGVNSKFQVAPKFLIRIIGLFVPIMKEMVEMMYQYNRDYVFDSSKFEKHFDFKPTPYFDGIKQIVQSDYQ